MVLVNHLRKRKTLVAAAALLSIGLAGSIATGAYFTDSKTVSDNSLASGTVVLYGTDWADAATSTPVTFTNVLPIADADIPTGKASQFITVVRNRGTAAVDWTASISLTSSDFAKQVNVQYKIDNGSWSDPVTLDALNGKKIASSAALKAPSTGYINWRAWLPAATGNSAQGQTVSFTLKLDAIQAGAPQS